MDQRPMHSTMQGYFGTRRWKQPRNTQQSSRISGLSTCLQAGKLVGSGERDRGPPCEAKQSVKLATACQPKQVVQRSCHDRMSTTSLRFLHNPRPPGLSKMISKTVSKTSASESKGPHLMPLPSTNRAALMSGSAGSSSSSCCLAAAAEQPTTPSKQADTIIAAESPARCHSPSGPRCRDRFHDLTVAAGLIVPATVPDKPPFQTYGGESESNGDSDRSLSPDLLCGSFQPRGSSQEPKTGVVGEVGSVESGSPPASTASRKRPLHTAYSQRVDRFPSPVPRRGDAPVPRQVQEKEPSLTRNQPAGSHADTKSGVRHSGPMATPKLNDFGGFEGARATCMIDDAPESHKSGAVPRQNFNRRSGVLQGERGLPTLLADARGVMTNPSQSCSSENDSARLCFATSIGVDSNIGAGDQKSLNAAAIPAWTGGLKESGLQSAHPSVAPALVGDSKPVPALRNAPFFATSVGAFTNSAVRIPDRPNERVAAIAGVGADIKLRSKPSDTSQAHSALEATVSTFFALTNTSVGPVDVAQGEMKPTQNSSTERVSAEDSSNTQPERIFAREHRRVLKSTSGRGRGVSKKQVSVGRGGNKRFKAPVAAQGAVTGVWRRGKHGPRWYITLDGRKITGAEAYKAFEADKVKLTNTHERRVPDAATITRGDSHMISSTVAVDGGKHSDDNDLKLSTYGVPEELVKSYEERGVRTLFPWQAECLRVDNCQPLSGGNLVYSAPTSGGKTLVAELLLLRALLERKGTMAILVVPFIALAMEKRDYLRRVWAPLELNIQAFHGSEGGDNSTEGVHLCVCTMEKANSIVNRLAEETRLEALSTVVVDEMHLIGDGQRGFLLELMLSKLRMACPTEVQLVCLSATLPNAGTLAKWLCASLYESKFRPVELRHRVCCDRVVYVPDTDGTVKDKETGTKGRLVKEGVIKPTRGAIRSTDPEGVVDLVEDALGRDMSVLVFCPNKKWCQELASLLAREIRKHRTSTASDGKAQAIAGTKSAQNPTLDSGQNPKQAPRITGDAEEGQGEESGRLKKAAFWTQNHEPLSCGASGLGFQSAKTIRESVRTNISDLETTPREKSGAYTGSKTVEEAPPSALAATVAVMDNLRETPVGLDPELAWLVGEGVAFHHSGLVVEERAILEDAFRQGSIRVLVATSTLAAGVNLPAHRVIIRSPKIGIGDLDSTRYHQMAGRSGRAGVSRGESGGSAAEGVSTACGESFLFLSGKEKLASAFKLISAPLPPLNSALRRATGGGLERALLEVVVSKIVSSRADATRFVSHTLLAAQIKKADLAKACDAAIDFLLESRFIVSDVQRTEGGNGERHKEASGENIFFSPTQLGKATFFSGLSPSAAVDVQHSLDMACKGLVVNTSLHALYLLTPLDGLEPDWAAFRDEYTGLGREDAALVVGKAVGIEAGVLVNAASQHKPSYGTRYHTSPAGSGRTVDLLPYRRFFAALVLQEVVDEVPIRNMATKFGIARGALQGLQRDAAVFCGMVVSFCRHLQWHELANVLFSLQDRLGYSAKPELLPLVRLSRDLAPFRARALLEAGYATPLDLARADPAHLSQVFLRCSPFQSPGYDPSAERHRAKRSRHMAENIQALAVSEIRRQLAARLAKSMSGN